MAIRFREKTGGDENLIRNFIRDRWNDDFVVAHGEKYYPESNEAILAFRNDELVGLITFRFENRECEIITIDSVIENKGIGSELIKRVLDKAKQHKCSRIWLITTNDNINAQRFYTNRGFKVTAVHKDAINLSRRIKPSIPLFSADGTPINDEVEFSIFLDD